MLQQGHGRHMHETTIGNCAKRGIEKVIQEAAEQTGRALH